ncbi:hypothetical protein VNO77_27703 [Canavalia gladiata]|uniref:Uncharacterized protein n=1 Tax=Canavalia gladiata TaxID=3824 RepID=A0AAN9KV54_CANGL
MRKLVWSFYGNSTLSPIAGSWNEGEPRRLLETGHDVPGSRERSCRVGLFESWWAPGLAWPSWLKPGWKFNLIDSGWAIGMPHSDDPARAYFHACNVAGPPHLLAQYWSSAQQRILFQSWACKNCGHVFAKALGSDFLSSLWGLQGSVPTSKLSAYV